MYLSEPEERIYFTEHAQIRIQERNLTRRTIISVLQSGDIHEMHSPYGYPFGEHPYQNSDPVFTIVDHQSQIAVGLALRQRQDRHGRFAEFRVITAMHYSEYSRHAARSLYASGYNEHHQPKRESGSEWKEGRKS
ncbi:DUF4258 domain-containing protein [Alicyclobacillus tolerans]|uniref:DUF4258 domain-containing protein n=1 Tax=Alicyclobacillus tolerans TaxID=90970 RepID=UPI003B79D7F9